MRVMLDIIVALCVINAVLIVLCTFANYAWIRSQYETRLEDLLRYNRDVFSGFSSVLQLSQHLQIIHNELIAEADAARHLYARAFDIGREDGAADALRKAADAAADNCASVLNDDDPTEANRWADTENWLRARADATGTPEAQ